MNLVSLFSILFSYPHLVIFCFSNEKGIISSLWIGCYIGNILTLIDEFGLFFFILSRSLPLYTLCSPDTFGFCEKELSPASVFVSHNNKDEDNNCSNWNFLRQNLIKIATFCLTRWNTATLLLLLVFFNTFKFLQYKLLKVECYC